MATISKRTIVFLSLFSILTVLLGGCEIEELGINTSRWNTNDSGGGGTDTGLGTTDTGGGTTDTGGGTTDGGASDILPAKILSWSPPTQYIDGSPLDAKSELDFFEIYVNENGIFSDSDIEMATVSVSDPNAGQILNTSFDLSNLSPFISQGVIYYVSVRAVSITGIKSGFSQSVAFSY